MKLTASCKRFFKPFKKMLQLFRFRLRKSLFVRLLGRSRKCKTTNKHRIHRSIFRSLRKAGDDDAMELRSLSDANQKAPFPSPLTPAYVRMIAEANEREVGLIPDEVEDACRSFEKYLAEMVVDQEGKMMRDLMDVQDLLYCWENLKCPVFLDLVSRFYRELCKDVFSANNTFDPDIIRS